MRWDVQHGREKAPDGADVLAHLEWAAARGSPAAQQALQGAPPFPEHLEYLYLWALELVGRSGYSQFGLAPVSYATIQAWAELTHRFPSPLEVGALLELDGALRGFNPDEPSD